MYIECIEPTHIAVLRLCLLVECVCRLMVFVMGQTSIAYLYCALAAAASFVYAQDASNPGQVALSYVDPLIGTVNGGHVFAGATLPFGMAKSVADVNVRRYSELVAFGLLIFGREKVRADLRRMDPW